MIYICRLIGRNMDVYTSGQALNRCHFTTGLENPPEGVSEFWSKAWTFAAEPAKNAEKSLKKLCDLCVPPAPDAGAGVGGKNGDSHVCPNSYPNFKNRWLILRRF
jgi:hypothetical protein